jgi:ATP-binding protein involved in chromosome partitioning
LLALNLINKGHKVGLFDLDFTSPTSHIILGTISLKPKEDRGIIPPKIHGINYMSIVYYSGKHVLPLRGIDISNALIELLAVTKWKNIDFLIIDMPPGISDATLDIIRLIKNVKFLIISTPSKLAFATLEKFINLLSNQNIPIIGVIENMKRRKTTRIQQKVEKMGIKYWGYIPFNPNIEEAIGSIKKLLKSEFAKKIDALVRLNLR